MSMQLGIAILTRRGCGLTQRPDAKSPAAGATMDAGADKYEREEVSVEESVEEPEAEDTPGCRVGAKKTEDRRRDQARALGGARG